MLFISNEHRDESEAAALGVAQLVRAYAVEHGALPTSLDALGPAAQGFELEALEQGWKVTRRDARPLMCSAFQPVSTESRVVQCEMDYDLIRKNLRVVYEGAAGRSQGVEGQPIPRSNPRPQGG